MVTLTGHCEDCRGSSCGENCKIFEIDAGGKKKNERETPGTVNFSRNDNNYRKNENNFTVEAGASAGGYRALSASDDEITRRFIVFPSCSISGGRSDRSVRYSLHRSRQSFTVEFPYVPYAYYRDARACTPTAANGTRNTIITCVYM